MIGSGTRAHRGIRGSQILLQGRFAWGLVESYSFRLLNCWAGILSRIGDRECVRFVIRGQGNFEDGPLGTLLLPARNVLSDNPFHD